MPAVQSRFHRRASRALLVLLALASASCASFDADRHVAPVYTEISRAGGGKLTEALGGVYVREHHVLDSRYITWGVRPLFLHDRLPGSVARTDFLYPLGTVRRAPDEFVWQLLPIARYSREIGPEGTRWSFISLLGLYFAGFPDGRRVRAWFPVAGIVEGNLTFERLEWVLFPLYARSVRQGRATYHFLWPIFAYGRDETSGSWRFWPLVGHKWRENSYDQRYVLWPIFQLQRSNLKAREEFQRFDAFVFPLYGYTSQGTFRSHSFLWPFFGYSSDSASGFWAWDGPWPLVRIARPGERGTDEGGFYRTRFWPFYSYYEGDGLELTYVGWPVFSKRHETYPDGTKRAFNALPFWQGSNRYFDDGRKPAYWRKLWPLYRRYDAGEQGRTAVISLDPFWNLPTFDRHYAWLWEAYSREWEPGVVHERSWLGLWRRERGPDEQRTYVTGVWSSRRYSREGKRVTERSLLFGLIRWRSTEGSLRLLQPALPGPGWPHERMPSSLLEPAAASGAEPEAEPEEAAQPAHEESQP